MPLSIRSCVYVYVCVCVFIIQCTCMYDDKCKNCVSSVCVCVCVWFFFSNVHCACADADVADVPHICCKFYLYNYVLATQKQASTAKSADTLNGKRGRGGNSKTDAEIKALAKQMRQSIKTLDGKIQKLDDEGSATALRSAHATGLLAALVALFVAQAH